MHALEAKGANGKIIGAIFVINGQIEGADIYRSHDLFAQMWPKLLRAYATEAIAFSGAKPAHLPKIRQLRQFLTAAEQAPARDFGSGNSVHESDAAIYTATVDKDGAWVYRSYRGQAADRRAAAGRRHREHSRQRQSRRAGACERRRQ